MLLLRMVLRLIGFLFLVWLLSMEQLQLELKDCLTEAYEDSTSQNRTQVSSVVFPAISCLPDNAAAGALGDAAAAVLVVVFLWYSSNVASLLWSWMTF